MVDQDDGTQKESRPPILADLLRLCSELNRLDAKYIVIGGMAVIQAGFVRATEDIDLLIEEGQQNQERVQQALRILPDQAVRDLRDGDLEKYTVVRIADEVVVDLMRRACGVNYQDALSQIRKVEIQGVTIPFAGPELLWRMKQTGREKGRLDLLFLKQLLDK